MIKEVLTMTAHSAHLPMAVAVSGVQLLRRAAAKLRGLITPAESYRPELHYMRGSGPKWRARHQSIRPGSPTVNCKIEPATVTVRRGGAVVKTV
jgi:hypothetical protein